jgi:excisionase family DNA binding protein
MPPEHKGGVVIQLLRKREAQDRLRISRPTLDRVISRGELPVVRLSGRCIRISECDLASYLAQRTERRGTREAGLVVSSATAVQ